MKLDPQTRSILFLLPLRTDILPLVQAVAFLCGDNLCFLLCRSFGRKWGRWDCLG